MSLLTQTSKNSDDGMINLAEASNQELDAIEKSSKLRSEKALKNIKELDFEEAKCNHTAKLLERDVARIKHKTAWLKARRPKARKQREIKKMTDSLKRSTKNDLLKEELEKSKRDLETSEKAHAIVMKAASKAAREKGPISKSSVR
jgi:hypothetical protein